MAIAPDKRSDQINVFFFLNKNMWVLIRSASARCLQSRANMTCTLSMFVLRFYGPVKPLGSCRAWSVLLGRLSPLSG